MLAEGPASRKVFLPGPYEVPTDVAANWGICVAYSKVKGYKLHIKYTVLARILSNDEVGDVFVE